MKLSNLRHLLLAACLLGCGLLVEGCFLRHCDSCTVLEILLPGLDSRASQTVQVEFQQVGGASAAVSCSWGPPASPGSYNWTCTKDSDGTTIGYSSAAFYYKISGAQSWTIQLTGPAGNSTITRALRRNDAGDGWPTSCSCDSYQLALTADDLKSVGAVIPTSNAPVDAGADTH